MRLEGDARSLVRDALDAFIVGIPHWDELRERIIRQIDTEIAAEEDDGA